MREVADGRPAKPRSGPSANGTRPGHDTDEREDIGSDPDEGDPDEYEPL